MRVKEDVRNIEWGAAFDKWGIVKRNAELVASSKRTPRRRALLLYEVVDSAVAKFIPSERRVAADLSYDEAVALCTILNTGEQHE